MYLLHFLDTYINLVKYLQNVPLDVSINWCYLHLSNMRSYWKYSKATICRRIKKNIGDIVVTRKTTKTVYSTKEKYLTINQVLARRNGKLFCKKRVMVKAGISPSIIEETVHRLLQKTDLK